MQPAESDVAELEARLARYPADRYPAQHATAAFHLGAVHLQQARVAEALTALSVAHDSFARIGMRLEQAKAQMMQGVALRSAGRDEQARSAFETAIELFAELGSPLEEAAATYNLGLVVRDLADAVESGQAFARAHELFAQNGQLAQAGAAAREYATSLLTQGSLDAARPMLELAYELAMKVGDAPGLGGAANALGLLHLAQDDPAAATRSFLDAIGAHPRSLRPAEYAMGKANLALARERAGDVADARLAALQAIGTPGADAPVIEQARQLLARVGPGTGDELSTVLAAQPTERWAPIVRDEVLRWVDAEPPVRSAAARGWIAGQLGSAGRAHDLAETLLGVVLELPPAAYEEVIAAVLRAVAELPEDDAEQFRAGIRSGMARYPIPQWQRMSASFERAAAEFGAPTGWS
ncbi:MAG: hypothetical protein ABI808_07445 [Pseudonocardiales bacterium]